MGEVWKEYLNLCHSVNLVPQQKYIHVENHSMMMYNKILVKYAAPSVP
jgi:hypothetical protein